MNNIKLLHIKCCFFLIFQKTSAIEKKNNLAPQEKVEITPLQGFHLWEVDFFNSKDFLGHL